MIKPCRCPNCGRPYNYYDDEDCSDTLDDDCAYVQYRCHCKCGCKFWYIEYYKLADTEIELMTDPCARPQ